MEAFRGGYQELEAEELVDFLLRETGQYERQAVNPAPLLNYLKLEYLSFEFDTGLPSEAFREGKAPRAMLSYGDRLIAVDQSLSPSRTRFSVLHETAHYVLPAHQCSMYLCDDEAIGRRTALDFEREANAFAASLLFKGAVFATQAAQLPITVASLVELAKTYRASFEATARRFVERNLKPVMLVVFKQSRGRSLVDVDVQPTWNVKYCVPSPVFRTRHFTEVSGEVPAEVVKSFSTFFNDIQDSVPVEVSISRRDGQPERFRGEFFYNRYNIMCLLTPI